MSKLIEWWGDSRNVADVAHWLNDRGELRSPEDAIYLFEKPWKFEGAWRGMRREKQEAA